MRQPRIYIAGPLTADPMGGTTNALRSGSALMDSGCAPFVPHLSVFWHIAAPRPYEDWMALDLAWLEAADAVLRLPGASSGADREEEMAKRLGIPVFYTVEQVKRWAAARKRKPAERGAA